MRIAILGATGFIGKNLTRELASNGHEITGYVVKPPTEQTAGISYEPISSLDDPGFSRISAYDVVINLAARRSTRNNPLTEAEVRRFTFEIPKQFFLKTAGIDTLVINSSTYIQNFEGIEGKTIDSYGAAKQELSEFLRKSSRELGFNTLDLFFFTLFGEGDRPSHLVPLLLDAAKEGKEISLSPGLQLMNLVYIDDAIQNILKCLTLERDFSYQKFHLWEENYFSVRELVFTIEAVSGVSMDCAWGAREYVGHEMMDIWDFPTAKFPGFEAKVTLEEGIRRLWLGSLKG